MSGRYWLVGASEGLGEALARQMHAKGYTLVLSARNAEKLALIASELPGSSILPLDVSDPAAWASADPGPIDGMVFLAGVYWPMRAEDLKPEEFLQMCEVNFMGAARSIAKVLPGMVAQNRGHIVLTGSLAAFRGVPGGMGYAASKAGVMSLAECLHADLRGSGVKVQLASPGFIRTRLTAKNDFSMPFLMEPEAAAAEMLALMESPRFSRHFPTLFAAVFRLGRFLPDWVYYSLFAPKPWKGQARKQAM